MLIKQISKREVNVLISEGYIDESKKQGIVVASKNKNSRGKRYYAEDNLAYIAWELLGYDPDEKGFQNWKNSTYKNKIMQRYKHRAVEQSFEW